VIPPPGSASKLINPAPQGLTQAGFFENMSAADLFADLEKMSNDDLCRVFGAEKVGSIRVAQKAGNITDLSALCIK